MKLFYTLIVITFLVSSVNANPLIINYNLQVPAGDSTDRVSLENVAKKAVVKSLIIPGWGQIYNAQQWRLRKEEMKENGIVTPKLWWLTVPVIYGGFVSTVVAFDFNQKNCKWILHEVQYRLENNNVPFDEKLAHIKSTDYLIRYKDQYRRDRDLCVLIGIGVYALNIMEAYISGMFLRYDIKDDLSLRITPDIRYIPGNNAFSNYPVTGLKLALLIR